MNERAIEAQRSAYQASLAAHGDGPQATRQNDRTTQHLRFSQLLQGLSPHFVPGTSLHDVGSGLCDLYEYLRSASLTTDLMYSGTEIVEEMNVLARRKYPELLLSNRDLRTASTDERYDFCVASGTFNLLGGLPDDEWRAVCYSLIEAMFRMSRKAIAFNVLTSYRTFSDPKLCYFDPRDVFDFATTRLSRFVTSDASAPLYEVTFTVFQKDFVSSLNPDEALRKYFR